MLRVVESHRAGIKSLMGAADIQGLRYQTMLIRLYVSICANVNNMGMAPNNNVDQDGLNQFSSL